MWWLIDSHDAKSSSLSNERQKITDYASSRLTGCRIGYCRPDIARNGDCRRRLAGSCIITWAFSINDDRTLSPTRYSFTVKRSVWMMVDDFCFFFDYKMSSWHLIAVATRVSQPTSWYFALTFSISHRSLIFCSAQLSTSYAIICL